MTLHLTLHLFCPPWAHWANDRLDAQHQVLRWPSSLKAIRNPWTDVAFSGRCVDRPFFEPPVKHKDVVEMYGKVRIQRPFNFRNRATPFVAPRYSVARNDQIPRYSIQSVLLAFAPIETPPDRNGDISSRSQRQCRFEANRIARPEKLCASRILTTLKEGVKGPEIRTRSVPVPTRNVEVNLDSGIPSALIGFSRIRTGNRLQMPRWPIY